MLGAENLPSSFNLSVKGSAGTQRATAEIHDYRWLEPHHQTYLHDRHRVDMVLSQRPPAARGRFVDGRARTQQAIGRVIFLPGGRALEGEWAAGEQQSVCCTIDTTLAENETDTLPEVLDNALDIRDDFVQALLVRLAREALVPGFASGLVVESLCQTILIDIQRMWKCPAPSAGKLSRLNLARVDEMLDANGPTPSTAVFAHAFNMSAGHFARIFRATTGRNISTYAADFRLSRAKTLLMKPKPMVKEIGWRIGFENAAAFSAAFRRSTGLTPRQFRALHIA